MARVCVFYSVFIVLLSLLCVNCLFSVRRTNPFGETEDDDDASDTHGDLLFIFYLLFI